MLSFRTLLLSSMKTYYRNPQVIFFSLFFPVVFMGLFGLFNFGGGAGVEVGVVDQAHNRASTQFISRLQGIKAAHLHQGSLDAEKAALVAGHRDAIAVLPDSLGTPGAAPTPGLAPRLQPTAITVYLNEAKPNEAQIASTILQQFADQASFAYAGVQPAFTLKTEKVAGHTFTYIDTLVPGIIGMSIMQTGIFSLAFALVRIRDAGILRRLLVTPMRITDFMAAQVITRLLMAVVQILVLLAIGLYLFHFHLVGNLLELIVVATFGATVFIAMGFVIAGISRNEDSVPAIANLVTVPMMFLSGVFFSRDVLPDWLHHASDFLPLTYLNDALRGISVSGDHLWSLPAPLLGIAIWLAISVAAASRVFKTEPA